MKLKISLALTVMVALVVGCSDSTNGDVALPVSGFIKATVQTARQTGQPVEFSFEHTVVDYPAEYYPEQGAPHQIRLYQADGFEGTWTGDNYSRLYILLDSLNQDTVALNYFRFYAYVPLQHDTTFGCGMNISNTGRITDYHYDASTHTISGKFTVTSTAYNGQPITVNGEFEAPIRFYLYYGND